MDVADDYLINCRLCAKSLDSRKKISIFGPNCNKTSKVFDIIHRVIGIEISRTDNLPRIICEKCNIVIKNIQTFERKCHQADRKLRKKLLQIKNSKQCANVDIKVKVKTNIEDIKIENEKILKPTLDTNNIDVSKSKKEQFKKRRRVKTLNICEICGVFSKRLGEHMNVHSKKRFTCPKCPNTYSHKATLGKHLLTHSEKKFLCEYCEMRFSCHPYLKRHLLIHTGERHYTCDICKKAFQTKYNLNTHIRIHTKEKPFKCINCELAFAHRATFNIHSRECYNKNIYNDIIDNRTASN